MVLSLLVFIKKFNDIPLRDRIVKKIKALSEEPHPPDAKRVKGRAGKVFRIRIGDYRVFYKIRSEENLLSVLMIENRSRAYKKK